MKEHNSSFDQEFQSALEHLDEAAFHATPSPQWFEQFVLQKQREQQSRFRRDILLFLVSSCIIVVGMFLSLNYGIGALVLFQVVITLLITLPFIFRRKERTDAS